MANRTLMRQRELADGTMRTLNIPLLPSFDASARRKIGNADKSACGLVAKAI